MVASVAGQGRAAGNAGPVTLVTADQPIVAFAQDGDALAWVGQLEEPGCSEEGFPSSAVYLRPSSSGPVTRLTKTFCTQRPSDLALAGRRVLWTEYWHGNNSYTEVKTAELGSSSTGPVERELVGDADGSGAYFGALAGDGSVLAYSVIVSSYGGCDPVEEQCALESERVVKRVEGRRARRVPGAEGGDALAVSAPNVATVAAYNTLTVRNAWTGRVVTSFPTTGVPRSVALTQTFVAVLVDRGRVRRIELRDIRTGALRRNVAVSRNAANMSAAGRTVAYSVGRHLYVLDAQTFRIRRLARAAHAPIGLSIEAKRIAWAENVRGRGAIRAVYLP